MASVSFPEQSHLFAQEKEKTGIIIVNLGTPDGTDFLSVRRYLKEFLSDQRVIEVNPILWKLILNLFILTFRPGKTAKAYKAVWRKDTNESPLRYYTRKQGEKLKSAFADYHNIEVAWAMRYGQPNIEKAFKDLEKKGCTRLVILSLYPQYSATTTATVNDEVFRCLMKMRRQPTLRIAPPYECHPKYIQALKNSIITHLKTLDWKPEKILVSFHGVPVDYIEKGDPYKVFCERTFHTLQDAMPENAPPLFLTFQSRFGPREWLQPYTDKTLEAFAQEGLKKIAVIAPGFASDCIETLEELKIEGCKIFENAGGTHFTQIPCLNDNSDAIDLFTALLKESLGDWINPPSKLLHLAAAPRGNTCEPQ
ncbi:MAG: ferrochelatase [Alphaproteobacteria bacterium]|nr:ferrochelatase [Alphaproteobacteria bacterium]NCQ67250.1 ferrochelatase [Alphaproteobacteria bacterium]NCT07093.1 ferrochelatase [Alphaproteobacteria bacterium]